MFVCWLYDESGWRFIHSHINKFIYSQDVQWLNNYNIHPQDQLQHYVDPSGNPDPEVDDVPELQGQPHQDVSDAISPVAYIPEEDSAVKTEEDNS